MKSKFFMACLGLAASLGAASPVEFVSQMNLDQNYPENVIINNRILLKFNGKAITIMDVVRKMDLLFYKQYANFASSATARYQFYTSGWRTVLGMVIDDCLIVADAEEKEVKVNDGEVREELERLFGPDVVINLDKMGMTLEEAVKLIKTELTVQRMTSMMVRSKAMADISPISVKKRYEKFLTENPTQDVWVYRLLSIRGPDHEHVAQEAHRLIQNQGIPFEQVINHLQQTEGAALTYSDTYRQKNKELSLAYRAVLGTLGVGATSSPISNKNMSRLFCLQSVEQEKTPSFNDLAEEFKLELTQIAMEKYGAEYRAKLRKYYGLTEEYLTLAVPEHLQPFALR
jgi:antitoxin component of RelBE/YafQ-DinJ toxin-antitoxin module